MSPPLLVRTSPVRVDTFTLLNGNGVLHQFYELNDTNQWQPNDDPEFISKFNSTKFTATPSVISKSNAAVDLDLFGQTKDNKTLLSYHYDGKEWTPITSMRSILISSPPAVVYLKNPATYFIFSRDGNLLKYGTP
jgi:hypothetical protein